MTDRIKGLTVVLDGDIREDDAKPIIEAIRMIRGVLCVEAHVTDINDYVAQQKARFELEKRIYAALRTSLSDPAKPA